MKAKEFDKRFDAGGRIVKKRSDWESPGSR